jgi:uncharacterized protein (DUF927 family)
MKNCVKKCVVVLAVLVIAFGVAMAITGCNEKSTTTKTTTVEKTTKK